MERRGRPSLVALGCCWLLSMMAAGVLADHGAGAPLPGRGKTLNLHLQHGLSNRMRTIVSAIDLAKKSGRRLRIISERDVHVGCRLTDLFEINVEGLPVAVVDRLKPRRLDCTQYDCYDYMTTDKYKAIDLDSPRDIYVKSAYRLNSSLWSVPDQDRYLRALRPSPAIAGLVEDALRKLEGRPFIGVHVRNVLPLQETPDLPRSEYKPEDWEATEGWRNACNATRFAKRLAAIQAEGDARSIYVAADSRASIEVLQQAVKGPLHWTDHGGCTDRSCRCLQYAIADLLLLGRAERLLGSYWSSFSEVAGALAGVNVEYAGKDF